MRKNTREIATSFTTLIFLVIAISGVMMFFHFNDMLVKSLHEILGLAFVVVAVLHVFVNWKSMKTYFSKKVFISASLITLAISSVFIYQSSNNGDNPKVVMMQKVLNAPTAESFKLLNGDYENAIAKLKEKNIKVLENKTIRSIAKANETSPFRIVAIITEK